MAVLPDVEPCPECGSLNVTLDVDVYDCDDCGLFFTQEEAHFRQEGI